MSRYQAVNMQDIDRYKVKKLDSVVYSKGSVEVPAGAKIIPPGSKRRKAHILINEVEHKHCAHCNTWLNTESFYPDAEYWDGLHQFCMECTKEIGNRK